MSLLKCARSIENIRIASVFLELKILQIMFPAALVSINLYPVRAKISVDRTAVALAQDHVGGSGKRIHNFDTKEVISAVLDAPPVRFIFIGNILSHHFCDSAVCCPAESNGSRPLAAVEKSPADTVDRLVHRQQACCQKQDQDGLKSVLVYHHRTLFPGEDQVQFGFRLPYQRRRFQPATLMMDKEFQNETIGMLRFDANRGMMKVSKQDRR